MNETNRLTSGAGATPPLPPCRNECRGAQECCNAEITIEGDATFRCTRDANHAGPHVACGLKDTEHAMHVWSEGDAPQSLSV